MTELTCTLVSDGSSDVALIPILRWLLRQYHVYPTRDIERYDSEVSASAEIAGGEDRSCG